MGSLPGAGSPAHAASRVSRGAGTARSPDSGRDATSRAPSATAPRPDWRRAIVYTHRWLGIAGSLLFMAWFVSGIVLMYAGMPSLTAEERFARLPELDLSSARVPLAAAAVAAGGVPDRTLVGMVGDRPAYRFWRLGRWITVFADTGVHLDHLTPRQATALARQYAPENAASLRHETRMTAPDQWTLQSREFMPLHRIALGDADDTRIYISDRTGEPVMKTTRTGRRLAYAGAVLHWFYFTPFRRHTTVWIQSVIWISIVGCVLTLSGLLWGVWRISPGLRYRLRIRGRSPTPYDGLMRWHHYAGLVFGFTTFTWVLSGCLSLDPFGWHPGTAPTPEQRAAVRGNPLRLEGIGLNELRSGAGVIRASFVPKELEVVPFRGRGYLLARRPRSFEESARARAPYRPPDDPAWVPAFEQRLVPAQAPDPQAFVRFDDAAVLDVARLAMPRSSITDASWLEAYDAYYYDRTGARPLPVLRVRYDDPQETWLYLDPFRGAIARKEERLTRVNRWLYHGLHSLDFPFLYDRRPLWDAVVIMLSIGGLALSMTSLAQAWQRLRRHGRRLLGSRRRG